MKFIKIAAVVWLAFSTTGVARASEVDRLLDLLVEKSVLTKDEAASFRADLAIERQQDLDKQAEVEKKKGKKYTVTAKRPIQVGGYAQVRGTQAGDVMDTFLIRRARLSFGGNISDSADYKLQIDVGNEARTSVSSVDFGKGTTKTTQVQRPVLLDAQVNYALSPSSRVSVGQFKIPFSQENLISSTELETINRSQVTEQLVPGRDIGSQGRDIGVTYAGSQSRKSGQKAVDYFVSAFNGAGINSADDNDRKDLSARVIAFPSRNLQLGASYYDGARKVTRDRHDRTGLEFYYTLPDKDTYLKGEYVTGADGAVGKDGWYALLVHSFNPKWQGVLKYDAFDPDDDKADNETTALTFGFNRFISENVKLQVNYELKNEQAVEVDNNALLAQFLVKF